MSMHPFKKISFPNSSNLQHACIKNMAWIGNWKYENEIRPTISYLTPVHGWAVDCCKYDWCTCNIMASWRVDTMVNNGNMKQKSPTRSSSDLIDWSKSMEIRVLSEYNDCLSRYGDFYHNDKMVMRSCYLYNGNSYIGKRESSYWDSPQVHRRPNVCPKYKHDEPGTWNIAA